MLWLGDTEKSIQSGAIDILPAGHCTESQKVLGGAAGGKLSPMALPSCEPFMLCHQPTRQDVPTCAMVV